MYLFYINSENTASRKRKFSWLRHVLRTRENFSLNETECELRIIYNLFFIINKKELLRKLVAAQTNKY